MSMKKYLMTAMAAVAMGVAFTSCSHNTDLYGGEEGGGKINGRTAQEQIELDKAVYKAAFEKTFGKVAPTVDWGFGPSTVAGTRGGTRTVPGIEFPNNFKNETNITGPGTIQKPTITKTSNAIVISGEQSLTYINDNSVVYLESDAVLTLTDWFSMQNIKFYMSSGSQLNVQNLYLKGNTEFVNDGGTIKAGTNNLVLENFTGTFWNNGTINVKEFKTSNGEGGDIYFGSDSKLNATNLFLFKKVLLRNEGEITLTGEFNADQYGHKIYNSGTITTPKIILQKETVLWNEGTITAANNEIIGSSSISNNDVQIYNGERATLKLENLKLTNNDQLVVNKGTLNVRNAISMENNSEINNSGTLTGSSMELKSGAKFYNESGNTVTISGLTKVYNNSQNNVGNVWRNAGYFNTGSFEVTGGVAYPAAFNNCHMTVTDRFYMNEGFFVLDGGAAVECGSFRWDHNNYFHMGGKALLQVTGDLLANNDNTGYGFYGDDTEYAVIQAGSVTKGTDSPKFAAAYFGNIFVDTNNHFPQGERDAQGTYYTFGDNVKFSFTDNTDVSNYQTHGAKTAQKATNFSIDIPRDNAGCSPGYKYGTKSTYTYRVIAEDLSATEGSDFDFNDVVFDVEPNAAGTAAKIVLRAAGGIYKLTVAGHEVHEAFALAYPDAGYGKGEDGLYPMINTQPWDRDIKVTLIESLDGDFSSDEIRNTIKGIEIKVYKPEYEEKGVELEAETGKPACKILVDQNFGVVQEREGIADKYTNFHKVVQGTWDTQTKGFWWKPNANN